MKNLINGIVVAVVIVALVSYLAPMNAVYGIGAVLAFFGVTRS